MTTEQRLERLERENRWMRRIGAAGVAAVAAVLLMGQGQPEDTGLMGTGRVDMGLLARDAVGPCSVPSANWNFTHEKGLFPACMFGAVEQPQGHQSPIGGLCA